MLRTSRALTLVFNWFTSWAIPFRMFTKCGRRKSAPRVSLARLIRSFAFSAIISLLLLSYFRKQRSILSMFFKRHSGRELISNSIRSKEISIIFMTVSLSSFKIIWSTNRENSFSILNSFIRSLGCISIRYLRKSSNA